MPFFLDSKSGRYPHKKIHLEVDPKCKPKHSRVYSVPRAHEATFKKELEHLVKIGVPKPCSPTQWAAGTFIIPNKGGRVQWISNFWELNKAPKRRMYPLPIIQDVIQQQSGYKYFTKLDLLMFFYNLELDKESQDLCTIVTPFGKSKYYRMTMGLKIAPDEAQVVIEEVLAGLNVEVYINNIGIFSTHFDEHLELTRK
eukprot:6263678-Ditylum_brightwellii.AAC.1